MVPAANTSSNSSDPAGQPGGAPPAGTDYKKNMLKTMLDIVPALLEIKNLPEAKVYKFETFKLK